VPLLLCVLRALLCVVSMPAVCGGVLEGDFMSETTVEKEREEKRRVEKGRKGKRGEKKRREEKNDECRREK
jgi:hypothetical protein